jgi:hypothetical protein
LKQYTSKFLKTAALALMAFPMTYLLVAVFVFDIPGSAISDILLMPWFYLASFFAVISGYGLWEMHRWGWYVYVFSNVLITLLNAIIVKRFGATHHPWAAFLILTVAMLILFQRIKKEVRVPYFLPSIPWWESDPRYRTSVPVSITRKSGEILSGEILDLSLGGCFIKCRVDVLPEEQFTLNFTLFEKSISCGGVAVWRTGSTVTHPKGVGVKFLPYSKEVKRTLKLATFRLRKISQLHRRSRYLMTSEEFNEALAKLQAPIHSGSSGGTDKKTGSGS